VNNAAIYGAKGAILYSDPADFAPLGFGPNDTFPNTPWLPSTGAQRGSIYKAQGVGDPLTPGRPSIPGVYRRPSSESGLPTIPAHPMSYGDAINFLKHMEG
jgi:N-acetylated-alpha-linked acidic dipeptidase